MATPRASHSARIAWVIAPIPPIAWPHAPPLPLTSPNTWCNSTYALPGVYGLAKLPTTESQPSAAFSGSPSNQRSSSSPADLVNRSSRSRRPRMSSVFNCFAADAELSQSASTKRSETFGGVRCINSRSTTTMRSSIA